MGTRVNTQWSGKMKFNAIVNGHNVPMDADEAVGGEDTGPRPKALLLAGLAGCTGMDVISILKKMQHEPLEFDIDIDANITEEHPKVFDLINIIYKFKGGNLQLEKLEKAVKLSQEKYCGVSAMLGKIAELKYSIEIQEL